MRSAWLQRLFACAASLGMMGLTCLACGGRDVAPRTEEPPAPSDVSDRQTIWGKKQTATESWVELVVDPGFPADEEDWTFYWRGLDIVCPPKVEPEGWSFSDCEGLDPEDGFEAFVPNRGAEGLRVYSMINGRYIEASLRRVAERAEPVNSPNVEQVWHRPNESESVASGIYASNGVVFAPYFDGRIELLDAVTGNLVSTIDTTRFRGGASRAVLEVVARDGYLYAATTSRGLLIFDVRDPPDPRLSGQYIVQAPRELPDAFTNVHTIQLSPKGDLIFAVNQTTALSDLRVIDVSNPARPREAGRYVRTRTRTGLDIFHDTHLIERGGRLIAFLHSLKAGTFILDATNPREMVELNHIIWDGIFSHSGAAFEVNGRMYYAHNDEGFDQGITVIDVSDFRNPRVVSEFRTRFGVSVHNIDIVDRIAYVAYYLDGLRVIDLSQPERPRAIGHYDTVPAEDEYQLFQGAWGVKVLDGRVYVSDMDGGTFAFEVQVGR